MCVCVREKKQKRNKTHQGGGRAGLTAILVKLDESEEIRPRRLCSSDPRLASQCGEQVIR